jgi:hypothetical protein
VVYTTYGRSRVRPTYSGAWRAAAELDYHVAPRLSRLLALSLHTYVSVRPSCASLRTFDLVNTALPLDTQLHRHHGHQIPLELPNTTGFPTNLHLRFPQWRTTQNTSLHIRQRAGKVLPLHGRLPYVCQTLCLGTTPRRTPARRARIAFLGEHAVLPVRSDGCYHGGGRLYGRESHVCG